MAAVGAAADDEVEVGTTDEGAKEEEEEEDGKEGADGKESELGCKTDDCG